MMLFSSFNDFPSTLITFFWMAQLIWFLLLSVLNIDMFAMHFEFW